jgi:hypothetical protein
MVMTSANRQALIEIWSKNKAIAPGALAFSKKK